MTASAILKLQRAGFTDEQVEALAGYFDDQLATKADLAAAEARLSATVEQVRGELKATEARLETKIEQVRGEIERSRSDTIKWVIGVGVAQVATIPAVLRLFPGHP